MPKMRPTYMAYQITSIFCVEFKFFITFPTRCTETEKIRSIKLFTKTNDSWKEQSSHFTASDLVSLIGCYQLCDPPNRRNPPMAFFNPRIQISNRRFGVNPPHLATLELSVSLLSVSNTSAPRLSQKSCLLFFKNRKMMLE